MSSIPHDHAVGHEPTHDDHAHHPGGIMRWITTTNHKDIGTLYLWFSFIMFLAGGCLALTIRTELFQPGTADRRARVLQFAHHAARPDHDVRRDHAGGGRLRQLAGADDDRRAGHGVRAAEQLELLAAAVRGDRC